ncbi:unnamed protein product [Durusdinium trenchii]|uniref:Pectin acetylesterase 3 n=2 Tax=Durusdinium trenchii TaxID=1381693 RepID=A0ABP0HF98_9DINO
MGLSSAVFGLGLFALITSTAEGDQPANAYRIGPETGYAKARCLDGSPGLYYFSPGSGSGTSKFQIFHEGGGFCNSDSSCFDRAKGRLGSSSSDPKTWDLEKQGNLKFSRSSSENPLMHDWNHIFLRYCDGGYFSGDREEPKVVEGSSIYFRGKQITEALFSDLGRKFNFGNATDVVISGCSAGAIRVYAHIDALAQLIQAEAKVVALPDSGFYMDLDIFTPLKRYVVTEMEGQGLLNPQCLRDHVGSEEKCLIGSVISLYLKTPTFAFQSRFDSDQQGCEMEESCKSSATCLQAYAANLTSFLQKTLSRSPHGYFLDSCVRHCSYEDLAPRDQSGIAPLHAFATWYGGGQSHFGQPAKYPCPECCGTESTITV